MFPISIRLASTIKMRIKRASLGTRHHATFWRNVKDVIVNRKTKIITLVIVFMLLFVSGIVLGLAFGGFFGSLDKPSERVLDFIRRIGLEQTGMKSMLLGIVHENIRIPLNYIRGQFSDSEKIYIDIKFDDYQKLAYKRQQYLDKDIVFSSSEDFVPATIRHNDKKVKVKLRLKGDAPEHIRGDKWSFRIKVEDSETLFGMRTFSIQDPLTRNYLYEYVFHKALKREGIVSPRYEFIEVVVNGANRGIYAIEEHFDKQLVENNNRREGIIIKFNEDDWYRELAQREGRAFSVDDIREKEIHFDSDDRITDLRFWDRGFYDSYIDTFKPSEVLGDPLSRIQFMHALNLLEAWRTKELATHEVFDNALLARYFAVVSILGADHATYWTNIRFYYNPISTKLEPIGFDANAGISNHMIVNEFFPPCLDVPESPDCREEIQGYYELIFSDPVFFQEYIRELERVSQPGYLDKLLEELKPDLEKNTRIIHKERPYYYFSSDIFYENQQFIRTLLDPFPRSLDAYYERSTPQQEVVLSIGNVHSLPLEIVSASYNNTFIFEKREGNSLLQPRALGGPLDHASFVFQIPPQFPWDDNLAEGIQVNYKIFGSERVLSETIFPWAYRDRAFIAFDLMRQKPNVGEFDFLIVDEAKNTITVKQGSWSLDKDLIIPADRTFVIHDGTTIDLTHDAIILSYSPLEFKGDEGMPVRIVSSDGGGQGLLVLNAQQQSHLAYVSFDNLIAPLKNGLTLTGAVTFYESPVVLNNVRFSNIRAEDNLNIIRSEFTTTKTLFENASSDCFDIDFSKGSIHDVTCSRCSNDCIDFSDSVGTIERLHATDIGDKGISVGENSSVQARDVVVENAFLGVTAKDLSLLRIENLRIQNATYPFALYQKKSEFGPARIEARNITLDSRGQLVVEQGSEISFDGEIIKGTEKDVYARLYPGG